MKEVLLQRYLESMLRMFSVKLFPSVTCDDDGRCSLCQLVTHDVFDSSSVYVVTHATARAGGMMGENGRLRIALVSM